MVEKEPSLPPDSLCQAKAASLVWAEQQHASITRPVGTPAQALGGLAGRGAERGAGSWGLPIWAAAMNSQGRPSEGLPWGLHQMPRESASIFPLEAFWRLGF